jgi:DNA-binding NarL/FixJ family response regulator
MSAEIALIIADDHPIVRRGIIDVIVAERGLKILAQVTNGSDAIKAIRQHRPNVAILDIEMPEMNGLEVARAVRDGGLPTAIVLLTMYKDKQVFNAAVDAGVAGYVLKENAETELLACIRSVAQGQSFFSPSLSSLLLDRGALSAQLRRQKPGLEGLTPTERKIIKLIAEDKTSKEIAETLGISPRTVDNHRTNMGEKLGISGTNCILKFAYDNKSKL